MITTDKDRPAGAGLSVVLVDDDAVFRGIVRAILARRGGVAACRECESAETAESMIQESRDEIDLLVVDWLMPGKTGLELVSGLRKTRPRLPVLLCTAHPTKGLATDLLALGVHGYLDKSLPLATIETALFTVLSGGIFFASGVGLATVSPFPPGRASGAKNTLPKRLGTMGADQLSAREREVACLVAHGLISKQIADRLGIAQRTVEAHRANLMNKLGISDVATLTRWCIRVGLEV